MSASNRRRLDFSNRRSPLDSRLLLMFEKLPSLVGFQPKCYTGGPSRFHLPLFYDLVATQKPKVIVVLGFGDGQAFFTFCQAVREQNLSCQCVAVRREHEGEKEADDVAWGEGRAYGTEFYGDLVVFRNGLETEKGFDNGSIDLLLLDDCDSGSVIGTDLQKWEPKVSSEGLVLFHGLALERADNPRTTWLKWIASRPNAEFPSGIGLGITLKSKADQPQQPFIERLFAASKEPGELVEVYRLADARIEAQIRADAAMRAQIALEARQVWIDSLLADRWKVQEIMDDQLRIIDHQRRTIDTQT